MFVLPSVSEPFGLTPLEALRFGTPPCSPPRPEWVAAVRTRARPLDPEALAAEVCSLLVDEGRRAALVAAGRSEIAGATWGRSARALSATFARAIEESERSGRRANR